jgi:hypothetical protein
MHGNACAHSVLSDTSSPHTKANEIFYAQTARTAPGARRLCPLFVSFNLIVKKLKLQCALQTAQPPVKQHSQWPPLQAQAMLFSCPPNSSLTPPEPTRAHPKPAHAQVSSHTRHPQLNAAQASMVQTLRRLHDSNAVPQQQQQQQQQQTPHANAEYHSSHAQQLPSPPTQPILASTLTSMPRKSSCSLVYTPGRR